MRCAARRLAAVAMQAVAIETMAPGSQARRMRRCVALYATVAGYDVPASVVAPVFGLSTRGARKAVGRIEDKRDICPATEQELQRLAALMGVSL